MATTSARVSPGSGPRRASHGPNARTGPKSPAALVATDPSVVVVPVIGARIPGDLAERGFWGALVGSALLGVVDPPLALLVGAAVLIARRRRG
jgi:hypothetical protein